MTKQALFIQHKTLPGKREAVQKVWRKHMLPAIQAYDGHEAYFYCFGSDPDTICAFQQYRTSTAADAFLKTESYAKYLEEVSPLLRGEPRVEMLSVEWYKS